MTTTARPWYAVGVHVYCGKPGRKTGQGHAARHERRRTIRKTLLLLRALEIQREK